MDVIESLRLKREDILGLATMYGARDVRLFGSVARQDAGQINDVDFLVDMEPGRSFLDLVAFWQELEELLGCKVDVITDGGVSPYLRSKIYAEAVPL